MKYTRGQFTKEYYQLWQLGLLLPIPQNASTYSVKYRKNHFDEYSRVTLKAVSVSDALERACYAITYTSPWRPEDIDLHAVYDSEENLLWIDEPYYDLVQKKNEFRGMERREFLVRFGATSAAILFGLRPTKANAGATTTSLSGAASGFGGVQLYATAGSYAWTVPAGVTTVSVVCVGAGGGSSGGAAYGGAGGGALAWASDIATTPSVSMTIVVGGGAVGATGGTTSALGISAAGGSPGLAGTNDTFSSPTLGVGGGGAGGTYSIASIGLTRGGGNGGAGGGDGDNTYEPGGGGAGGYSGKGGDGGRSGFTTSWLAVNSSSEAGVGGAASGGGGGGGASGGGVGIYGIGTSGSSVGPGSPGIGGSGGTNGDTIGRTGGAYGGGGGGAGNSSPSTGSSGGSGAVRIIWGPGRRFPSNAS